MGPTITDILNESDARLKGVDSPRLSAEVLIAEALGCSRLSLVVERNRKLDSAEVARIHGWVDRRAQGEPLAYILGRKEFYGLDFSVNSDVLIPRPETEHIIEILEESIPRNTQLCFADLGTGSGILAVTISSLFHKACGVGVDVSHGALSVARKNAVAHGVGEKISFIEGDFTMPLFKKRSFDLIVSNPPYVPEQEYRDASHEVTDHEPIGALVSGEDGLDHIRSMLPLVAIALKSGGRFLMEIGYQQAAEINKIVEGELPLFQEVQIIKDHSGHDRIVSLQKI